MTMRSAQRRKGLRPFTPRQQRGLATRQGQDTHRIYPSISGVMLFLWSAAVVASGDDLWTQTASAVGVGATMKASFGPPCRPHDPRSALPVYQQICQKVGRIPDAVIDAVTVPYLKRHLTETDAKEALAFWSSPRGKVLLGKILREIETGTHDQLSSDDLKLLDGVNRSTFGRGLLKVSEDREQVAATIQAIKAYEP